MLRLAASSLLLLLFFSSCIVKDRRVVFHTEVPLESQHQDIRKDSLRFALAVSPDKKNIVVPLFIYKGNKKKSKIEVELHGKGISGRDYTVTYRKIEIWNDTTLIGRSADPDLFDEEIQRPAPKDAVSPLYGTKYILPLPNPREAKLRVRIEFEIKSHNGLTETFTLERDLQKIEGNNVTLLNVFK